MISLDRFPRTPLCHAPTALELMPRLTEELGGPRIWIKRDDCTGLATGGNKARKLEFLMGEALAQGADHVLTVGAVQSNHVRQTAAAAAKLGMGCSLLLEHRVKTPDQDYLTNGNLVLDTLMGATIEEHPGGADMLEAMGRLGQRLAQQGRRPYLIPGGGSNAIGTLGYVVAMEELLGQMPAAGLKNSHLVLASGSAGTHAGSLAGLLRCGSSMPVLGIAVGQAEAPQRARVQALLEKTMALLEMPAPDPDLVIVDDRQLGPGYSQPTEAMMEAIRMLARLEGILLDPVYTGKAMAGLIAAVREGRFAKEDDVIFLHTGGQAALGAFPKLLS